MCLDALWTSSQKDWLAEQPDTIIAYKVVLITKSRLSDGWRDMVYPPVKTAYGKYKKTNIIGYFAKRHMARIWTANSKDKYLPFYHLFKTKFGATRWIDVMLRLRIGKFAVLKCEIPKDKITEIGRQDKYMVIVTKEFTFVEGDKYFAKEEE